VSPTGRRRAEDSPPYHGRSVSNPLTDAKGQVTSWGYDAYGRPTAKTNAANTDFLTWEKARARPPQRPRRISPPNRFR